MLLNALLLSLREIRRNLLRSFLTMLGIVIGVAAVIVMVTLGEGATAEVSQQISRLGTNMLQLRTGQRMSFGMAGDVPAFNEDDVAAIEREVGNVAAATPLSGTPMRIIYGNENWSTTVTGTDDKYFQVRNWQLAGGRIFNEAELRAGKAVCIIGATVRRQLFGGENPLDNKIRLDQLSCQVIGLLAEKGQSTMGSDQDDVVLLPLRTFQRRISGNRDVKQIQISVREGASTDKAKKDIQDLMRERRRVGTGENDNFNVLDMKEISSMLSGTTQVLTTLLGAVAAISLLVGGIGIMNIMLVSVTERTREIGIRMAIGALEREVLLQFLVEAVGLSSLGGIIGIAIALLACLQLTAAMKVPYIFNPQIIILAFTFSAAVGVVFGYVPARKAARLDPIEALRHE